MIRRLIILDAGLMVLLVLGGFKLRQDWRAFGPAHDIAAIQPKPQSFPSLPATAASSKSGVPDWTDIPSKDPFSFDRNDIDIVAAEPAPPPKPLGPKPILFGIMVVGADRTAFVAPGPAGNRNSRPMKVGEAIDGWTIVQIADKSVDVEANGTRQTVIINDPAALIPRDNSRTASVVSSPAVIQSTAPQNSIVPAASAAPPSNQTAPPPSQTGPQGQKGHWETTPFGIRRFVPDPQ